MSLPANICNTCRNWSELDSQVKNGHVSALCLCKESPNAGKYTTKFHTCSKQVEGDPLDANKDWTPEPWEIGRNA